MSFNYEVHVKRLRSCGREKWAKRKNLESEIQVTQIVIKYGVNMFIPCKVSEFCDTSIKKFLVHSTLQCSDSTRCPPVAHHGC
jgi:hypothetical protein